ncbi:hypothetical protein SAMN05444580_1275 [Rhodococcus tukisamuensis]|uniref:Uncharacterized protein n=1 Tax=Rhodococcus tukisamuensis TaxID=168276 RepID=A0A1G7EU03_9NOCA|nr:hypothetical protein SAMN05444580_1275 [Rhodococcus tukisamuensis]
MTGRRYTVARHVLVQQPNSEIHRPSVLGPIVTDRKRRSLQLYLLLLTVQSLVQARDDKGEPPLRAGVLARALCTEKGRKWTPTHVSAAWNDLEDRGLVERRRLPHGVVVKPRREDGKADYSKPGQKKGDRWETYFVIPPEFWTEEWFERLSLPGLAMLLIIASETSNKAEVWLTNQGAAGWYGMSERSVQAGIADLKNHGLLDIRVEWVKASLSAIGATDRHWYSLLSPFSYDERRALQKQAKAELEARQLAASADNKPSRLSTSRKKSLKRSKPAPDSQPNPTQEKALRE